MEQFNWKDYVGIQPLPAAVGMAFYLEAHTTSPGSNDPTAITLSIMKFAAQCTMSEQQVSEWVEDRLYQFPIARSIYGGNEENRKQAHVIEIDMFKNRVAQQTRRGRPNKQRGNTYWYVGEKPYDAPMIVTQFEDKFDVFKHPGFDKYGFIFKP